MFTEIQAWLNKTTRDKLRVKLATSRTAFTILYNSMTTFNSSMTSTLNNKVTGHQKVSKQAESFSGEYKWPDNM
jgi:hypothetical protein